jgi:hypothetical protein
METTKNYTLDWESFGEGQDHYMVKLNVARNERHYLKITRRVEDTGSPYHGTGVILFEDDFPFFVEALSMIMTRYTHGEGRPA